MAEFLKIATLDSTGVNKIRSLEQATGTHIMAFEMGLELASLSEEQMNAMKALEKDLGVILIVYNR